jgi:membrane-bound lytic murein transglycosylase D
MLFLENSKKLLPKMKLQTTVKALLLIASTTIFAQEQPRNIPEQPPISYLDSIKKTFKNDELASCVDSLWMKELTNTDIFDNLQNDVTTINIDEKVDYELPTDLLKARLKEMDEKSPFNIEYNQGLENIIKSFLKNRKKSYERLMAISEYYFPMFEEALSKQNIPLEIKYLAVVESALNPKAVSRVGATGLWQFMYHTGKQYNLNIDSYIDERSDVLKSSDAAATYMKNMYKIFGDWDLVLASYNSGPGNVTKAIRRSNGNQNFWNIRKFLPKETQGYVPAFLATMYIYEYHKEHGIVPNKAIIKHFATDTILVKQQLSFKQISDLLDVPVAQLQLLNPSYKMNVVPFYKNVNHYLRMPLNKIAVFTSNEDKVYAYANYEASKREKQIIPSAKNVNIANDSTAVATSRIIYKKIERISYYKVKKGDNLGEISEKYGISQADLKKWNRLRSNNVPLGKKLKIISEDTKKIVILDKKPAQINKSKNNQDTLVNAENKTKTVVDTPQYYVVQKGDNLHQIAKKFGVTETDLQTWNNLADTNIELDARLKILKSEVSISQLKQDSKSNKTKIHVVEQGESIWTIANQFGVSAIDIMEWNDLKEKKVKKGQSIIILTDAPEKEKPVVVHFIEKKEKTKKTKQYSVKAGDTLTEIADKFPGVTVADIKKWNKIKGNNLRPGMKLKING